MSIGVRLEAGERGVADAAPGPVRDPLHADRVVRIVDHLQVRDRVLHLRALVEARAADHLVRDLAADEHVLQHPRLRVRPVEDRDLVTVHALVDEAGDLGRDPPGLGVLVLDLEDADRLPVAELGPEVLRLPLGVVRDHVVGRAKDGVRRAVVLLERHHTRLAEVALELEDVADVGSAQGVDRLVRVADDADVPVLLGQELEQAVLRVVRVLVLVDEDVAEGLLPALLRLGEALEHLDGEHQQVVEVDGVRGEEPALVQLVRVGDRLVVEGLDPVPVLGGVDQLVLGRRDLLVDAARDEPFRISFELLQALLDEPHLVGLVVDREVRSVAEPRRLAAEDPAAGGMEREDPDAARDLGEQILEARAHLPRRLVRERDRKDLVRLDADRGDQVGDPVGEDAGLPRARAGDDEQRALRVQHRLALGGVQVGEIGLRGGCNGHGSMLARHRPGSNRRVCPGAGRWPPSVRDASRDRRTRGVRDRDDFGSKAEW